MEKTHEAIKRHIATDTRLCDNKDPQRRVSDLGVSYVSSAQADKLYVPNMLECGLYWVGEYDSNFVLRERIRQCECNIENLKARIRNNNENNQV